MIKKIILINLLLLFTIGTVTAHEIPNGFHKNSENFYTNGDYGLSITNYSKDADKWIFNNDTDYIVREGNDHIYNYTDRLTRQVGVAEVTSDGLVVEVYANGSDVGKCYQYLLEFNKLNNVKPVTV